ncbi:MAG: hypothetical protein ACE5HC_08710 [Candidatus Binatia bacterium]
MADEKTLPLDEEKWWIDRGPTKEREKETPLSRGIIDKWVYEMLKDYRQEQALGNIVDINQRIIKELPVSVGEWRYISLGVGRYPANRLARIKNSLQLPSGARAFVIDAGYSIRVLVTGEPMGERVVDINFTGAPSLDYWVGGELVTERLFRNMDDALRKLKRSLYTYLNP